MKRRSAGNEYVKSVIFLNTLNLCNLSNWVMITLILHMFSRVWIGTCLMSTPWSVCVCVSQGGAAGQVSVIAWLRPGQCKKTSWLPFRVPSLLYHIVLLFVCLFAIWLITPHFHFIPYNLYWLLLISHFSSHIFTVINHNFFVSLSTCGLPFHVAWAKRSLVRVTLLLHFSGLVRFIYERSKITPYTFTDSIVPSRSLHFTGLKFDWQVYHFLYQNMCHMLTLHEIMGVTLT